LLTIILILVVMFFLVMFWPLYPIPDQAAS
jgi:hypothetical protein